MKWMELNSMCLRIFPKPNTSHLKYTFKFIFMSKIHPVKRAQFKPKYQAQINLQTHISQVDIWFIYYICPQYVL